MKLRSLAVGLTLVASGVVIGTTTQQFASADVASGDRPVLVPIETCRLADTRPAPNTVGPRTSPLGSADTMTIDAQQAGTDCTGRIPASATALSLNVTALDATTNSFLTLWPDGDRPVASSLNPAPGARVFNAVTTQLAADQTFNIFNNRGSVNVFVDVNGYYDNHNHDDRYYTQAQVDAAIQQAGPLVYGRISQSGVIQQNSGLIENAVWDGAAGRYEVTFTDIDFVGFEFVTVATPHCNSTTEPMLTATSFSGDMVVTIFDDNTIADRVPTQCAFSFIVYGAP